MSDIVSRPYKPGQCCEACAFRDDVHADWCDVADLVKNDGRTKRSHLLAGDLSELMLDGWLLSEDTFRRLELRIHKFEGNLLANRDESGEGR